MVFKKNKTTKYTMNEELHNSGNTEERFDLIIKVINIQFNYILE